MEMLAGTDRGRTAHPAVLAVHLDAGSDQAAVDEAGIPFVDLRGDTTDRAAPVQRFEAGEVPLFLIC